MGECMGTHWIWLDKWRPEDKEEPVLALFRKEFTLTGTPKKADIQISADSRYKLYVNGQMVEMGPSRGDRTIWFYDNIDLTPYISEGRNVLAVQVLRYPLTHHKGNFGIFRTEHPGLYLSGQVMDASGLTYLLDADASWRGIKDPGFHIVSESDVFAPLQIYENRYGSLKLKGWMSTGYDDSTWEQAVEYRDLSTAISPGNIQPRTIPFLYRKERIFDGITVIRQSAAKPENWEKLIKRATPLTVPAHTSEIIELSAGEEMTGYLHLHLRGGTGTHIAILQSESYVQDVWHGDLPLKKDRCDWNGGHLHGFTDHYHVAGFGTEELDEVYEPFWFRTFRFIRLEIETADEPLTLARFHYTETGYPLEVRTEVETSDESLRGIWEISERTLRRCMHETYEDCPFYEQLQYAMDSRAQILYTYSVAADDRLARKCMDDFRRAQRYDGLLNCSYPMYGSNVIPGFSIYYILMLYDHMMYFGDQELLLDHLPTVERILRYFHKNLTEYGYVQKIGGLNGKAKFWSFIDWTPEWDATTGVPEATLQGPVTMESLLYIMGLQHAAKITEYLGYQDLSREYQHDAVQVQKSLRQHCIGKKGMLTDGPNLELYSQQVQVFALLTDTVGLEEGRRNLEETVQNKADYPQCSVAMAFYLFRALQKAGLYAATDDYWDIWRRMIAKNSTTCVEDEVGERSDCHAWGSLILYELPSVILGVQPAKPGYEAVAIRPEPGYLHSAKGTILTPKGFIRVEWSKKDNMELKYQVPAGMDVIL